MEKIIDRIRKLLVKGMDRGTTEHEAQLFIEKAHEMLAEHNLSMQDLSNVEAEAEEVISFMYKEEGAVGLKTWKRVLARATAHLYFCDYFTNTVRGQNGKTFMQLTFVGRPSNVEVACRMMDYFLATVDRLHKEDKPGDIKSRAWSDSYKSGCALRLVKRIEEIIEMRKRGNVETSDSKALVVVADNALAEARNKMYELHPTIINAKIRMTSTDAGARAAGFKAGDRISLNTQVGQDSKHAPLLG